jgi:hypothetical protein
VRGVDKSPLSSAEVKNKGVYSTASIPSGLRGLFYDGPYL